ncbi:hypothetical protein I4U23_012629 [Adineta vaga]|nr:hypothetical protein I4U23_012629 [Adineta vaga]
MTQRKIDDLFSLKPSLSTNKRSRTTQVTTNDRDEFDDIFETTSSSKRRRTNQKPSTDVFDFDIPSTSTNIPRKSIDTEKSTSSLKKKRSDENQMIDDLFNNDTRKKTRRPIKQEETIDVLDMFKTRTNTNAPPVLSTMDDFKTPICPKNSTTQKKIKMFFDDTDLIQLREQDEAKDYAHVKPVLVTSGQWLSKEVETKSSCKTNHPSVEDDIPDDQRNLMHIQYVSLSLDDEIDNISKKKSKSTSSNQSTKTVLDGKSFQKQLVLSDSTVVRKENLQSCYNALLEDINKPRIVTTSSSNKQKKLTNSKSSLSDDDDQMTHIDFFDLSTRKKKF